MARGPRNSAPPPSSRGCGRGSGSVRRPQPLAALAGLAVCGPLPGMLGGGVGKKAGRSREKSAFHFVRGPARQGIRTVSPGRTCRTRRRRSALASPARGAAGNGRVRGLPLGVSAGLQLASTPISFVRDFRILECPFEIVCFAFLPQGQSYVSYCYADFPSC